MVRAVLVLVWWMAAALPANADPAPHFIVLPGIEGIGPSAHGMAKGLHRCCPGASVELFDWTTGNWFGLLYHLCAWERNQAEARRLAEHIQAIQAEKPSTPIILVGHSGGGAMIVLALEQLPPGCLVRQAILIAPALSPRYPLALALEHATAGIDVFHSSFDCVVLGVFTLCMGTIDREWSFSAGMVGFRPPAGADDASRCLYCAKLRNHGFNSAMCAAGHFGGHFTCTLPSFVAHCVGPVLRPW
jgi:pimeloyl-ACP methyl ester carboxylesterase